MYIDLMPELSSVFAVLTPERVSVLMLQLINLKIVKSIGLEERRHGIENIEEQWASGKGQGADRPDSHE
jgi:hypothetical protein